MDTDTLELVEYWGGRPQKRSSKISTVQSHNTSNFGDSDTALPEHPAPGSQKRSSRFSRPQKRASSLSSKLSAKPNPIGRNVGDSDTALPEYRPQKRASRLSRVLNPNEPEPDLEEAKTGPSKKGFALFAVIAALSLTGLLSALEATMTSTALPTIIADVHGGDLYIWVINGYYMTQTAIQPLVGQLANIYGRRWPMLISVSIFVLGSGIGGGANSVAMLIAARLIQGLGSGGLNVLMEIIICDLVPLRERGKYLGILFGIIGIGSACGPLFGGLIVQYTSWRWVFFVNLPVGGAALVTLFVFLRVKSDKTPGYLRRLAQVDAAGNLVFIAATVAVLIALSWAGAIYPWSSFRIIVPLVLGLVGLALFILYEGSRLCANPTVPLHHFSNRTSSTAFALTFLNSLLFVMKIYFLPVYFQAAKENGPTDSGIHILPTVFSVALGAIASGQLMSKFGRYRPIHHLGFALTTVGFGLLVLLNPRSSTGTWIGLQIPGGFGIGLVLPILLPAVQASLTDEDTALSTSTWTFIRGFGQIWGSTIPVTAFDNEVNRQLYRISDPTLAAQLSNGQAYEKATKTFIKSISDPAVRGEVQSVYVDSIRVVWWMGLAFSALGFVLVGFEKEIKLREEVDSKYGQEKG